MTFHETGFLRLRPRHRRGAMGMMSLVALVIAVFLAALAIDVGYIMMTKTQMQAAADSSALAGGTELMPGLGRFARRTPGRTEVYSKYIASLYASRNPAGELNSCYVDADRDIRFGRAKFLPQSNTWQQTWGASPFNMVQVTLHRNQADSQLGDQPVPLFFARSMGITKQNLTVRATAVLLPANGFRVNDPDDTIPIVPFAYRESFWRRLEEAQKWYYNPMMDGIFPNKKIPSVYDPDDPTYPLTSTGEPMFHRPVAKNNGNGNGNNKNKSNGSSSDTEYVQDIYDQFFFHEPTGIVLGREDAPIPDGILEVNMYPEKENVITSGNFGTIDWGKTNNASPDIARQIRYGLSASDFEELGKQGLLTSEGALVLDPLSTPPSTLDINGDTGVSAGPIEKAMNDILGEERVIALFREASGNGNNTYYTCTEFVGIRILRAVLGGKTKSIWVQMAPVVHGTAVADLDGEIDERTTVFAPLTLIE